MERDKWEYKEVHHDGTGIHPSDLQRLGEQGWEMCGIEKSGMFYFKRKI